MDNSRHTLVKRSYNQNMFSRDVADSVSNFICNGGSIALNRTSGNLENLSEEELLKTVSLIVRNRDCIKQALNEFFQEVVRLVLEGRGEYGLFLLNGLQKEPRSYRLVQKKNWDMVEGALVNRFKFRAPKSFGGSRKIKKVYGNLSDDSLQYMDFIMSGIPTEGLKNNSHIYASRVTSAIGWRQYDDYRYFTTFYNTYRRIKFGEFITEFRESLVNQLNTILVCRELSMEIELDLEGVLKAEDFPEIYEQLSNPQTCDFEKISDLMLNRV